MRSETWDISLVLRALQNAPFEPMQRANMRYISAIMAVLLALTTASRGSELTALTINRLTFSDDLMVTLFPDPDFAPKSVSDLTNRAPVVLHAFYPTPVSWNDKRLSLSCPVRAVRIYLEKAQGLRDSDRLLLAYAGCRLGTALTTQETGPLVGRWYHRCVYRAGRNGSKAESAFYPWHGHIDSGAGRCRLGGHPPSCGLAG